MLRVLKNTVSMRPFFLAPKALELMGKKILTILCFKSLSGPMVIITYGPVHEISNNVVCATSKASDKPAHKRSLIRAFASRLSIL